MKNILKFSIASLAIALTFVSCSKNDATPTGNGSLKIQFENGFAGNDLVLNSPTTATSKGDVLKISSIKYVVSNIVLYYENGTTFTYPKSQSYFIVDQSNTASLLLNLSNIPAGNYNKVKFGIGVDKAQYDLGQTGIGDFWATAQTAGMTWSWASGFKFIAFEGTFTNPTAASPVNTDTSFMIHTGKSGSDYNYTEVTVNMTSSALVRTNITPQIHLSVDLSKIVDGTNKIGLAENNGMGMGAMIMGGPNLALISSNLTGMFSFEHVHNDPN
jgi:hypothetical protein